MTPEQIHAYRVHRKTGKVPGEQRKTPLRAKYSHGVVMQCGVALTHPLPWPLAGHKMKEFKQQGLKGLKLKGVNL